MRVHCLEITAFGPFADTVTVDFDRLSDAGLFLLSGPTGAGKSSVLDAACFALYGDVPGDRGAAKQLRCDLAPEGRAPRVCLDATIGGRRFRFTRSPAWERPKKRGSGTTRQQATVLVQEVVSGEPVHLTNRLDEAGHLVGELLGMNVDQFTQVVMLPQGRFQDFLRARSEDRHRLLQQLFRTRRFEQVELWLRRHRTQLRRASESHAEEVLTLVHRLHEAAGEDAVAPPPDDTGPEAESDDAALATVAEDGTLLTWARGIVDRAAALDATSTAELRRATRAATEAERELTAGREVAERRRRLEGAHSEQAALDEEAARIADLRARVDAAHRARPVVVVHEQLVRARARCSSAADALASATGAARGLVTTGDDGLLVAEALTEHRDRLANARSLVPVEAALREVRAERDRTSRSVAHWHDEVASLEHDAAAHPEALVAAEADQATAREAQERLPVLRTEHAALRDLDRLHAEHEQVLGELDTARVGLQEAVDTHQRLREHWLDVQEQRLTGMAAELATGLAVGAGCPVCGSCDHPRPAPTVPGAPGREAERGARREAESADAIRQAHQDQVRTLETRRDQLTDRLGDRSREEVRLSLAATEDEIARLDPLAASLAAATTRLDELREAARTTQQALGDARVELTRHSTLLTTLSQREQDDAATLDQALGGHADVGCLIDERADVVRRLELLSEAVAEDEAASGARDDLAAYLASVADEAGFHDAGAAVAASLPADDLDQHRRTITAHEQALARVGAVLADPELQEAGELASPDLGALEEAHRRTGAERSRAEGRHRVAEDRAHRTVQLYDELVAAMDAWAPVRADHDTAAALASLAEGKSGDNTWQMRLSAYVLARRLGQVVAAANERLARMSDRRYTLEHTAHRGAGERRGGLSLRVVDDWSGEARDPVTLSGGETFVVSLALALGLTDVVTQEAGGTEIGTLFVDEGFGTLDADTLDDVMDTLDGLREGGRVVGIVSHVTELRDRIPAQLHVGKSRSGSSLASTLAPTASYT